ncbi:NAD(P)H-dependent glycerol-3-phosphate dehydrogenase [uncultured Jatrophihabitans sp.]|uniref:NAD(P)H-dependent glycerol-3-phosphate dehydrogenase n=1 Tax=uncultured Jatrophihabitans sp. TaxID=1610747 RepID=UPI0035CA0A1D
MTRAAVLGAGSWGTTFAKVLVDAGNEVTLWARRPELAKLINAEHANPDYLPDIALPPALAATHDAAEALDGADFVAIAIPSQSLRENLLEWTGDLPRDATLISLMKGVELGSAKRMSEVIAEVAGAAAEQIAVVSGPNLALEIAQEQPTATVVACVDEARAVAVQERCGTGYFRPYTNVDVVGCELGGAVKNVIALACGIGQGMGFGDNSLASIITRGLSETARLGACLGADPLTFAGLAGLGDLVATCNSPLSRNRGFGERLGRGESLEQAQAATHGQVAEGVKSCRSVLDLARRHDVEVPITAAVEAVCFGHMTPAHMVELLMSRSMKSEVRPAASR